MLRVHHTQNRRAIPPNRGRHTGQRETSLLLHGHSRQCVSGDHCMRVSCAGAYVFKFQVRVINQDCIRRNALCQQTQNEFHRDSHVANNRLSTENVLASSYTPQQITFRSAYRFSVIGLLADLTRRAAGCHGFFPTNGPIETQSVVTCGQGSTQPGPAPNPSPRSSRAGLSH